MKKTSNQIVVYWCPWWTTQPNINLDLIYKNPQSLFKYAMENYNHQKKTQNFIQCPAVSNRLKQTYFTTNLVETEFEIVYENQEPRVKYLNEKTTNASVGFSHAPTLKNNQLFEYDMRYGLFAEESLHMGINSPYFQKAEHLKYGAIVPGTFDIGSWYRPIIAEFNLWANNNYFHIQSGEPLMYWQFNTDKEIILKRYERTPKLSDIADSLVGFKLVKSSSNLFSRYRNFNETSLRSIILKEIKNNLVED